MRLFPSLMVTGLAALSLSACATVSKLTIENRLEELGLSQERAACMAGELDNRLNDQELAEFAEFTVTLTTKSSRGGVISALRQIDNPRIAGAVAASGLSCLISR